MEPESLRLVSVENLRWMPPSCLPDASQMLQDASRMIRRCLFENKTVWGSVQGSYLLAKTPMVLPARLIKPHLLNLCSPKNQWSFPTCLIKAASRDGHPSHRIDASEGARDFFLGEKQRFPPTCFCVKQFLVMQMFVLTHFRPSFNCNQRGLTETN